MIRHAAILLTLLIFLLAGICFTLANGQNVTHDADGNMTLVPVAGNEWRVFHYDARNRLTSVDDPAVWENLFDAEGIRTEIRKEGVPTKFVVSPGALPKTLVQINPDGTRRYFVYGLGLLYHIDGEEVAAPVTTTYHYNGQGSTVALSDDSGTAVGRFHYDPYGLVLARQGNTDTVFQFNGHYGIATDPTGLVLLNARFYNPPLKRFMNSDPAGFAGGMNWFAYSSGDPVNQFDPLGLGAADSERYTWIDGVQDGIGVLGFWPIFGAAPDGVNGVIYLFRGKWTDAGFSFASMIPVAEYLVAGAKYADRLNDVRKIADEAANVTKSASHFADDVIHVTPNGVALPSGGKYQIPSHYVENPHRVGNYGEIVDGKYVERLRIDPATLPGYKGPSYSHYHIENSKAHYSPRSGDYDPGF